MSESHELELAQTFAELARALLAEPDIDAALATIVSSAVDTIPGCESAGVALIEKRKIMTRACSDEMPQRVDLIEYESDQGPCLDAVGADEVVRTDDLTTEERWPAFASRAVEETGVRSMLAFRLFANGDTLGALNLYSKTPSAFNHEAEVIGGVLAAHAAVAMSTTREVDHLRTALESRGVIDQAKGIIMASTGCSPDEAFNILKQQSQALNEKLRDIAAELVERHHRSN